MTRVRLLDTRADTQVVRTALHEIDEGALLDNLASALRDALAGSDDGVRFYVRAVRDLAGCVLEEAHRVRPDVVVRTGNGELAVIDARGEPRTTPLRALEEASVEAPLGPWTARFPAADAVALALTSRVRELLGLGALE